MVGESDGPARAGRAHAGRLHAAAHGAFAHNAEAARKLLEAGADPNVVAHGKLRARDAARDVRLRGRERRREAPARARRRHRAHRRRRCDAARVAEGQRERRAARPPRPHGASMTTHPRTRRSNALGPRAGSRRRRRLVERRPLDFPRLEALERVADLDVVEVLEVEAALEALLRPRARRPGTA